MRASGGLYPALGRYFSTMQELAEAACMGRTRLWMIQRGKAEFTDNEKMAICNAIIAKIVAGEIEFKEMRTILEARKDFDGTFRATAAATAA